MLFSNTCYLRFPVPPPLEKSKKPFSGLGSDPAASAIEIAPLVFVHVEEWPSKVLLKQGEVKNNTKLQLTIKTKDHTTNTAEESKSLRASKGDASAKTVTIKKKVEHTTPTEEQHMDLHQSTTLPNDSSSFYGLTLCVGKHIYTSVVGVHVSLIEFILDDWLKWVPTRDFVMKRSTDTPSDLAKGTASYPGFINL